MADYKLIIKVGLPYLRARAQDFYERLGGGRSGEDDAEPEIHAVSIVSSAIHLLLSLRIE
jgi:hypothetical protein